LVSAQRLKLKHDEAQSDFGFNFNLRRYIEVWQIYFGFIVGLSPVVIAAYEFGRAWLI
jgi:hypothetical protein